MVHSKFTYFFIVLFIVLGSSFPSLAQVNLQTGSAVFSIPMFDWKDDKSRLVSTVALSYNSGNGLRVNDIASNVGQGWNLVAGGVITRIQVGEPDDQPAFAGQYPSWGWKDRTKYPAGYLYAPSTAPMENGCPTALASYPTFGSRNVLYAQRNEIGQDRQLDRFAFQFNGKSGVFVIDTSGGWHGLPLGDTKMKISLQLDPTMTSQGIRTTITSFTITDVDGLIYKFTQHGLTKLLKGVFSNADGSKIANQPKIGNGGVYCQSAFDTGPTASPWYNADVANPFIISNWYLSEVDDPFLSRKILFSYVTRNLSNFAGTDITFNKSLDNYVVVSYKKSVTTTQEISSITYPDGHVVNFNYAAASRFDYPGQKAISSVSITYNGRYLSQYLLNTTYFIRNRYGTPTNSFQIANARLCLRSVKKIGVDLKEDSPPYQFDYNTGSSAVDDFVPPNFCYAKDIWGYYNGNNSIASNSPLTGATIPVSLNATIPTTLGFYALKGLCFQNDNVTGTYYNAKDGYAKNGLLKQVIYPTGGSLTYQYAQNKGAFIQIPGTTLSVGGVHVSQTSSSDGGYSNGCGNPIVTKYDYVVNGAGSASSLWGLETPVNSLVSNNDWKEEHKTINISWTNPIPHCKWHYIYPGILSQYEAVSLDAFQKFMTAISPVLGVLSVVSTISDIINVFSSASFLNVAAVVLDVIGAILSFIFDCPQQTKYTPNTVYYNFDLNLTAPLPAQFKRVEITESSGAIGKTVQLFTHGDPNDPNPDYALWSAAGSNTAFSVKQRFAPWAYGLPKLTTVYDVNGSKIKETENVYDFSNAKEVLFDPYEDCCASTYWSIVSYKCQVVTSRSQRADDWVNPAKYNAPSSYITTSSSDMIVDRYYTYTGRTELSKTYERTYRTTDATQFVQTETDYYYNDGIDCRADTYCQKTPTNFDVRQIVTKQSNGDINYKNIYYPTDYNTGPLATLVQKNMLSIPVVTRTSVLKAGGSTQYLNEKVTEFVQLPNLDIKPFRTLEQRFASPSSSLTPYSGPTTTDYSPYKIPQIFSYDANGNLVGLKDEGNRVVTNIYDYNDKYIVASVVNANAATDRPAYTSFESLDLSRSGWALSGTSAYNVNVTAATGKNTFTLLSSGTNSLTASSLNTGTAYILSFWASNGNFTVPAGATPVKSAPTYNGFTYYEYNIPAGASSVVFKNNNATNNNIDELRLYPVNARMRTTTYDPLIGKTSECDENNRITFYTYDNLGRLQTIQDETHNIVKMYEYNNVSASKQTGCPTTYSNQMISELVTRSNCGAGYQGGSVTYTVPAGQFTSTISQEDADNQAETYLLTNAQDYADNSPNKGACYMIYYNTAWSETDTTTSCDPGYIGGVVTYTVPAGTYSSIINQGDADQQAKDDLAANAWAYVNSPEHSSCTLDTNPDWDWFPGDGVTPADPSYCLSVNGNLPPHLFIQATDVNPNSSTWKQRQWFDYGPNAACPANTYYNPQVYQTFNMSCPVGYTGTGVTYIVPPGKYSSTASQNAATQQALDDITANGQNYANDPKNGGTCVSNACNSSNCTGEGYKCVNGSCQHGTKVYTSSTGDGQHGYVCYYHYVWSDGSTSGTYSMQSATACPVQ